MQRRIYQSLVKAKEQGSKCSLEITNFLKTYYFKQFSVPVDIDSLVENMYINDYEERSVLFEQGESIHRYYFLMEGRVFLERRVSKINEKSTTAIMDHYDIIGQYFYDNGTKRSQRSETIVSDSSTIILSVDKCKFDHIYESSAEQYNYIKKKLSEFSQISMQNLENKGLYKHIGFKKYKIGDIFTSQMFQDCIGIIYAGQCTLNNNQGTITLVNLDCLNLESYFKIKKNNQYSQYKYRVLSYEMKIFTISFQYIQKLPKHFQQKITFLQECHANVHHSFNSSFNASRLSVKASTKKPQQNNKFKFPKMKMEPIVGLLEHTQEVVRQYQVRVSQKMRKTKSILELQQNQNSLQKLRKMYCLGYSGQKSFQPKVIDKIGKPRGYFDLNSLKKERGSYVQQLRKQKDWASYIAENSREKEREQIKRLKKKDFGKQNFRLSKGRLFFQKVFKKNQQLQSFQQTKKIFKLQKIEFKDRLKQFIFPSNI